MKIVFKPLNLLHLLFIYFLMYFFHNPILMILFGSIMVMIGAWYFPLFEFEDEQDKQ